MTKRYCEQFKHEAIHYVQSHPESEIATISQATSNWLLYTRHLATSSP